MAVVHAGEAFIPVVGPSIVILHSIRRSGWLCVLGLIPYVGLLFFIWLVGVVPGDHGRTKWWIVPFLIPLVNLIIFIILSIDVAKAFGKGAGFGIGLLLLPFIFYPILGFGSAQYQGGAGPATPIPATA